MSKQVKSKNQQIVENDILRYKKNKLASSLALIGLVFNCLYFMLLYAMPKEDFRTFEIGFSVILTLVVLLTIFLASEGVKGYNKKFSIVLLVVAAFQILRIFGYPLKGIRENLFVAADSTHTIGYFGVYPTSSNVFFTILLVYLIASAACLIASAVIGWIYAVRLEKFQKDLDSGVISVETALKEFDKEQSTQVEPQPEQQEVK
jgi:xanthine/uracil permease